MARCKKGIGHNPKLCVINVAEEILFQGSCLRFLQNVWHSGCWVTDYCVLVASWGPELYSVDLKDFSTVHQPSLTLEAIGWIWEREGTARKPPHNVFERDSSLRSPAQVESRAGIPFTCSVWSCKLVRDSFARARLGCNRCHVTFFLSGLWKRYRKASVAVIWQGIHICRDPHD